MADSATHYENNYIEKQIQNVNTLNGYCFKKKKKKLQTIVCIKNWVWFHKRLKSSGLPCHVVLKIKFKDTFLNLKKFTLVIAYFTLFFSSPYQQELFPFHLPHNIIATSCAACTPFQQASSPSPIPNMKPTGPAWWSAAPESSAAAVSYTTACGLVLI